MKLIKKLQEMLFPFSEADIIENFEDKLEESVFEGIEIDSADIEDDGIEVVFTDGESELSAFFVYDEDDGPQILINDIDDETDLQEMFHNMGRVNTMPNYSLEVRPEIVSIDLSMIDPPIIYVQGQPYIDLRNLSWMDEDLLLSILNAGDVDQLDDDMLEASAFVIRGGKKVKKALVRRRRRKILSPKQKAGIRKAVIKRKQKQGKTNRKRKKALKIRKRLGIKTNTNKNLKVAGTSDRRR